VLAAWNAVKIEIGAVLVARRNRTRRRPAVALQTDGQALRDEVPAEQGLKRTSSQ
jgi:hypothetical protein